MSHAELTRRIRFQARHRFWRPERTEEQNRREFGVSASAEYHGHDYYCDVTVRGRMSKDSGMIVDLAELDRVLDKEVRQRFDRRTINVDVPEFADEGLQPSGENLARFIFERVRAGLAAEVQVVEVVVAEDDTLRATFRGD